MENQKTFFSEKEIMEKGMIYLKGYKCLRCGHEWVPRKKEIPKVCPKCKSAYWNVPRKIKKDKTKENIKK